MILPTRFLYQLSLIGAALSVTSVLALGCAPTSATKNLTPRSPSSPTTPAPSPVSSHFTSQMGVISGSKQAQVTALGYKSFGSLGEPISGISQTTALGYKAIISVQGNVAGD